MQMCHYKICNKRTIDSNWPSPRSPLHDWINDRIDVIWIPKLDLLPAPEIQAITEPAHQRYRCRRILRFRDDVLLLPVYIRGWLIPETDNDSDLLCMHLSGGVLEYANMIHAPSNERVSYRDYLALEKSMRRI